ncbi:variable surface protein [Plasmodium gonderi]|uniref:Variable surface protein n=1 Tax=Plasmodium gonderi TaxID=77519 RepID=A0A1Y1JPA2_PLAGO|nr:variable surface protein [Plasmodium gonderi]GAW84070.1 variable surface protein [Plasmodium gonderi]
MIHEINESIYGFVNSLFPECKEAIEENRAHELTNYWDAHCQKINDFSEVVKSDVKNTICPQVMLYLYKIYSVQENPLKEVGFKYIYYWLYKDHLKEGKKSSDIKTLYEELLKVYNDFSKNVSNIDFYQKNKSDDELENLKDIYDLNIKLQSIQNTSYCNINNRCDCAEQCAKIYNRLKSACISHYDHNLHNVLDKYRNKFIDLELNSTCDNILHLILPLSQDNKQMIISSKSSIVFPRTIPIFVMLILSFFLFLVYKFSPYGLWMKHKIKSIKKKGNNDDEISKIMEFSEIYNDLSMNSNYNLSF